MRVNLILTALLAVGIGLIITSPRRVSSELVHTCSTYAHDDPSTCGSGYSSSGECPTSQITHIGWWEGTGTDSEEQTPITCKIGDGVQCNDVPDTRVTKIDDSYYCRCTIQHDPECCYDLPIPYWCSTPTPTPTPAPSPTQTPCPWLDCEDPEAELAANSCWGCPEDYDQIDGCCYPGEGGGGPPGCNLSPEYLMWCRTEGYVFLDGNCFCGPTPILIDVAGNGFDLTNAGNGVMFDFAGRGATQQISWTSPGSDDAWLALDRNRNGLIDSGKELLSNVAAQSQPPDGITRNGFRALAMYDKTAHGGNSDGVIDLSDAVFPKLRLWQDVNHNGISEPAELHTLIELGLESMSLDYRESRRHDRYGNVFRYRAKVYGLNHRDFGRWAYDVFLISADQGPSQALDGTEGWQANRLPINKGVQLLSIGRPAQIDLDPNWLRGLSGP